ncbi:Rieske (2Fe-2S) protein [Cohnella endophytica]|uniref:Rieske (2Fe-2S) protein n=1 Tax=Cohnella endophytica TaxID=2419778 RepID=A0A494XTP8_9BACL|nr:Rieske 2Fe-2S domain-containing protein [Cohnella endophytica]RKP54011.1 Rieske (2Fe-2S) protein [Cohnella endophytica]
MREQEIEIGTIDAFGELPAEITLEHTPYWLVRTSAGEYRLLLAVCPHAGGDIRPLNGMLICPLHFWTFDSETGKCLNDPDERLMQRTVLVRDGRLFAIGDLV